MSTRPSDSFSSMDPGPGLASGLDQMARPGSAPPAAFLSAVRRRRRSIIAGRIAATALLLAAATVALVVMREPPAQSVTTDPGAGARTASTNDEPLGRWVDRQLEHFSAAAVTSTAHAPRRHRDEPAFLRPGISDTAAGLDDWLGSI